MQSIDPARRRREAWLSVTLSCAACCASPVQAAPQKASSVDCLHLLSESSWTQRGAALERREVPAAPAGGPQLVRLQERGIAVEVQVLDRSRAVIVSSVSPLERGATHYVYLPAGAAGATLLVRTREPASLAGTVQVAFLAGDAAAAVASTGCAGALRSWAEADASYARGRAVTLGRITADAGSARAAFENARRAYLSAHDLLQGPGHAAERGLLELNLAAVDYYALKDWSGSGSWAKQAMATFTGARDAYHRARSQALLAAASIELATNARSADHGIQAPRSVHVRFADARTRLLALARFHAARHEWYDWALQINNIGLAYTYESRFAAAAEYFARAQRTFEQLGDATRAALALQNIGYCDWGAGRLSAAITQFDRAVGMLVSGEQPYLYLIALNNNGLAHYEAGRLDEALRLETLALDLATQLQSLQAQARSDFGIGVTYYALGDRELAADFLRRGLDLATPELDSRLRVDLLRALGRIEQEAGNVNEAAAHDAEALRLASTAWARARILLQLAQEYAIQGDSAGAGRLLEELITHPPHHDELVRAMAYAQRAHYLRAIGWRRRARSELLRAIAIFDRFDSLVERFEARVELAQVYADQGRDEIALDTLQRALRALPELRAQTANPEYRSSVTRSLRPALSLEMDLLRSRFNTLAKQGRFEAAQAVARESLAAVDGERASGFEAWRAEYLEEHANGGLAALLAQSATLYRDMAERRFELNVREDRAGTHDARARALREDIARLRARLGVITAEVARRSRDPQVDQATGLAPSGVEPAWARGRRDGGVIEYWLGGARAYAWVVRDQTVDWIELAASARIEQAARTLHTLLRSSASSAERREACAGLYRLVIAPLRAALSEVRDLTVIPDGALHYVPFAALRGPSRDAQQYLVQAMSVSVAPALRSLARKVPTATASPATGGSRMLLVADPVYAAHDPRLGEAHRRDFLATSLRDDPRSRSGAGAAPDLARLESSAREAAQIRALLGAQNVDLLQGEGATREAVLARDLSRYRFIHIASHGLVDSEIPQLSALVLATRGRQGPILDPYLRASDLLTRTFHAEAIVLSGCDTSLGKESASEGLVGLRYAALARGAHAVVASLWSVSDGIAASLMVNMYRRLAATDGTGPEEGPRDGLRVARALSMAIRGELERAPGLDPALWAPFTVYVAGD